MRNTREDALSAVGHALYEVGILLDEAWGDGWTESEDGEPDDRRTLRHAKAADADLRRALRHLQNL